MLVVLLTMLVGIADHAGGVTDHASSITDYASGVECSASVESISRKEDKGEGKDQAYHDELCEDVELSLGHAVCSVGAACPC